MTTRPDAPDLILHSGLFTTLDRSNPTANAVAIKNGAFTAVGRSEDVMPFAGPSTRIIGLKGRRGLPRPIDNHVRFIRGGLTFNAGLRWDGVPTLAAAMELLKRQVAVTPPPQWVRVIGGYCAWGDTTSAATAEGDRKLAMNCGRANACTIRGHNHALAWSGRLPISDLKLFWGVLGCACRAI
jgi:predicted amidohydrolase YtcJ